MSKNNDGGTSTQTSGIVWLSVGVMLVVAALFFMYGDIGKTDAASDTVTEITAEGALFASTNKLEKNKKDVRKGGMSRHESDMQKTVGGVEWEDTLRPFRRRALVVELNGADTTTLQILRGIGPTFARRIVAYRNRLGGFCNKGQLLEVYGMDSCRLQAIAPFVVVDTAAVVKLKINSIGLKEMVRHPYFDFYQAADIVRLRQQGQTFSSVDDLRSVPSVADSDARRLAPYVDFSL